MKKFEIGHTYFDRYACDYETLSVIKIVKRTAKTVVFERNGETRRALLREDSNGEYIIPDHYSMACVYRADSEIVDGVPNDELDVYETDEAEEAPESLDRVHKEIADDWFRATRYLEYFPTPYDCSGQKFTSWYKLFRRRGHWFAYHCVSIDV